MSQAFVDNQKQVLFIHRRHMAGSLRENRCSTVGKSAPMVSIPPGFVGERVQCECQAFLLEVFSDASLRVSYGSE